MFIFYVDLIKNEREGGARKRRVCTTEKENVYIRERGRETRGGKIAHLWITKFHGTSTSVMYVSFRFGDIAKYNMKRIA